MHGTCTPIATPHKQSLQNEIPHSYFQQVSFSFSTQSWTENSTIVLHIILLTNLTHPPSSTLIMPHFKLDMMSFFIYLQVTFNWVNRPLMFKEVPWFLSSSRIAFQSSFLFNSLLSLVLYVFACLFVFLIFLAGTWVELGLHLPVRNCLALFFILLHPDIWPSEMSVCGNLDQMTCMQPR